MHEYVSLPPTTAVQYAYVCCSGINVHHVTVVSYDSLHHSEVKGCHDYLCVITLITEDLQVAFVMPLMAHTM